MFPTKIHTQTIEQNRRCWPSGNPGTIGNEQRRETGITIFQYVSNSNDRNKIPMPTPTSRYFKIPIPTLKNTEKIPNTNTDLKCRHRPSYHTHAHAHTHEPYSSYMTTMHHAISRLTRPDAQAINILSMKPGPNMIASSRRTCHFILPPPNACARFLDLANIS